MDGSIADAVIANRGLNFATPYGGYGYGHGNFKEDGSVTNANILANRDAGIVAAINTSARDGALSEKIGTGNANLSEQLRERTISDRFNSLERQMFAFQSDTQRDTANLSAKVTECCCKLEAQNSAILAKLDAQALDNARTENMNLRISMNQGQAQGN